MALEDAARQVDHAFTREDPRGHSFENTFAGALSFLRRRYTKDLTGVDVAVTGIPFDSAVTNRPGARLGPRAIREASALQTYDPPWGWDVDPMTDLVVVDYGDLAWDYARPDRFAAALEAHIDGILAAGALPLSLGGDHYVSWPILRALHRRHGPISLIQFDAHTDTWPDDDPERIDHGTMFYKAIKAGVVDPAHSVQVGIRTVNADTLGVNIIDARTVHLNDPLEIAAMIRRVVGDRPAYVSFDIDCLDPAFAPGTGTPVWGGLASWQAAVLLREIAGIRIIGGDVVEVAPPYDPSGATAVAGAHAAVEILCLMAHRLVHERAAR